MLLIIQIIIAIPDGIEAISEFRMIFSIEISTDDSKNTQEHFVWLSIVNSKFQ
jgi:hypothetical protein